MLLLIFEISASVKNLFDPEEYLYLFFNFFPLSFKLVFINLFLTIFE